MLYIYIYIYIYIQRCIYVNNNTVYNNELGILALIIDYICNGSFISLYYYITSDTLL